jgi:hypothetical protein
VNRTKQFETVPCWCHWRDLWRTPSSWPQMAWYTCVFTQNFVQAFNSWRGFKCRLTYAPTREHAQSEVISWAYVHFLFQIRKDRLKRDNNLTRFIQRNCILQRNSTAIKTSRNWPVLSAAVPQMAEALEVTLLLAVKIDESQIHLMIIRKLTVSMTE